MAKPNELVGERRTGKATKKVKGHSTNRQVQMHNLQKPKWQNCSWMPDKSHICKPIIIALLLQCKSMWCAPSYGAVFPKGADATAQR